MKIRLGYVSIALNLPKITASSTVTYTNYEKQSSDEKKLNKLKQVTLSNLDDLYTILQYNVERGIHFYRITSKLIPLATHPKVDNWNYREIFSRDFERIGKFIKENNMRVDTHPDQFNVLNSIRDKVVDETKRNLWFHVKLFEDLNYSQGKMVLHVGSSQEGKDQSIKRFINNFNNYPKEISSRLILENDDKIFTAKDVLRICKEIDQPMVLDVHHHKCNSGGESIGDLLQEIFNTWNKEELPPKIHFSSPRESELDRKHSDYINSHDFVEFLELSKCFQRDFDVMLEAKQKDLALLKLIEDIKNIKSNWKWLDQTTLEL